SPPARPTVFPYTTLFRSVSALLWLSALTPCRKEHAWPETCCPSPTAPAPTTHTPDSLSWTTPTSPSTTSKPSPRSAGTSATECRSEEHTSELQSRENLVC